MKINLIFFLARFGKGGAGNSVYRLCKGLNKKKFNITVLCLNKCAYEKKMRKNKIKVIKILSSRALFSMIYLKKHLKKNTSNKNKNILISNINYTNLLCAIFIKKKENLKLIAFERTPFQELEIYFGVTDFIKKFIIKFLIRFYYKRFDKIICNSIYIGNYLKKKYGIKSITIHPPSIISNNKIIKNKNYSNKKIVISTICRLSKEKAVHEIIYALNHLKLNNIELKIIGDGPEKKNLKDLTKKLSLTKNVQFYGHKTNIEKYLLKTNLYINSSYFEGFPNSVVEAANLEVPIISSQSHGGINEILLNGKCGTIYNGGYKNLAFEIKRYLKDPEIFYKKVKLAKKNVAKFNHINHQKKFEKLLNKI